MWRGAALEKRGFAHAHVLDLCRLLRMPTLGVVTAIHARSVANLDRPDSLATPRTPCPDQEALPLPYTA